MSERQDVVGTDVYCLPCWGCGNQVEMTRGVRHALVACRQLPLCGNCLGRSRLRPAHVQQAVFDLLLATTTDVEVLGTLTPEQFGRHFDQAAGQLTPEQIASGDGAATESGPPSRWRPFPPPTRPRLEVIVRQRESVHLLKLVLKAKDRGVQVASEDVRPLLDCLDRAKLHYTQKLQELAAATHARRDRPQSDGDPKSAPSSCHRLEVEPRSARGDRRTKAKELEDTLRQLEQARAAVDVAVSGKLKAEEEARKLRESEQELRDQLKAEKGQKLRIDLVRTDGGTQMREAIDPGIVDDYAEALAHDAVLPPVVVFKDDEDNHWLADGFQRLAAHKKAGRTYIHADVREGTKRDALLYAVGANAEHGARRTNADKRKAVQTLLKDPEWRKWSNREIAKCCHVDDKTVGGIRRELEATAEIPQLDRTVGRDGKARPSVRPDREADGLPIPALPETPPDEEPPGEEPPATDPAEGRADEPVGIPLLPAPADALTQLRHWWGLATEPERREFLVWAQVQPAVEA